MECAKDGLMVVHHLEIDIRQVTRLRYPNFALRVGIILWTHGQVVFDDLDNVRIWRLLFAVQHACFALPRSYMILTTTRRPVLTAFFDSSLSALVINLVGSE